MRSLLLLALVGCATEPPPGPDAPQPLDEIWTTAIRPGDVIAMVPGTGSYDYLAAAIEALPGDEPLVDVRAIPKVAGDAIVFEQAIGAARRAGITDAELEAGALTFGLWGAGFTRVRAFDYVSYDGVRIRVDILGGENSCARGLVVENLFKYTPENANTDAQDLYMRVQTWLAVHPATTARNVIVASHSWGGAVAEWLAFHADTIASKLGPLADGTPIRFTIAAGVPAYMPNYVFAGPSFRDVGHASLYEIDRPDDPVHAMNPSGNGGGHQYSIVVGDTFLGSYGVTTFELACDGVAGACL